ncbi:bifunctional rhamnulose-1-phosphate aldolase/short-chain dehydrogenase [Bradyrhizobium manausense]|uniref:bifunctional rhamnulose-1-phosphate aldolase/short-chain dehydrogenase n=1 Tax=Bradyrhizobium manausense TaxID=989370 RepID=UPI001BA8C1DF|nr:bifunctional rhamnulose-1-phosphate aldolase/short-chain dehydrogenase [Bradyrhizobium manausense]MBR0688255.1 bifunctional rhamnulose-1-phosphate aldolase/short-chain dehydrogenase [Bradyrhizobium manausense]MBR0832345.1 bifunctional rhamnulose-1-phosphate aldolase/short-chain dehydrogenase [Bradyrhizobium manausense]
MSEVAATPLPNLWDDAFAAGLDEAGQLLYRSNLLGADLRITNFGGGNTSAKIEMKDPLTRENVRVLWVKGSGGDIGSMKRDGFSTLYLDRLESLKGLYRGLAHEDEMVALFNHCTFDLNPRATSIDTPLHAFVPHRHVDHVHADAVIAIAASEDAERLTREVFGGKLGFLPWQRPGFDLGLKLGEMAARHPDYVGVVLGGHGLFTWAETSKACYEMTLRVIQQAADWLAAHEQNPAFGGAKVQTALPEKRRAIAARLMPLIRGKISADERKIGHFTDAPEVLEFVNSQALTKLAPLGTSCPDHFLRTKIRPLLLPYDPARDNLDEVIVGLDDVLAAYRRDYAAYYERCKHPNSPAMRDPNAVVYLAPGIGMFTFAKDKATARVAAEFYVNAINVMRGASGVSAYVGLAEQEAFNIEYWLLEEAKLQRMPKPKSLAGRIAYVTGGAGGIGGATAQRLLGEGACLVIADIDEKALNEGVAAIAKRHGRDAAIGVKLDVTDEAAVIASFEEAARAFGGIDIVVSNAGIASASPVEDTSLGLWQKNMDILATGYFLVSREAFRLMQRQNIGGAIIFVASKNGLAASAGASAYCAAKASEIHLARCLALEGAVHGIRVNTVNPDAVLRGSKIWEGEWRQQRAASNKVAEDQLEEVYRQRSMLKLSVFPEDIAEGVYFFASDLSAKSTGNILNVDAGNAQAFTR